MVFMPRSPEASEGVTARQLQFVMTFLRDFHFRWLLVSDQAAFVHLEPVLAALVPLDPPTRVVAGGWRTSAPGGQGVSRHLPAQFFALSFDVKHLLASPRVSRWLRTDLPHTDDLHSSADTALNAWLAPLDVQRMTLQGVFTGWGGAGSGCPGADASVVHPVTPRELYLMSESVARHGGDPCALLSATDYVGPR